MPLIIDSELKALIPALSTEEYQQLESNIIAEGCRDALIIWDGYNIILDGHNRYEICTRHDIPFEIEYMHFSTRKDAMLWMIRNQMGRRNLNESQRAMIAAKMANMRREDTLKQNTPDVPIGTSVSLQEAADILKVGRRSVARAKKVHNEGTPELIEAVEQAQIPVSQAAQIAKLEPEKQREIVEEKRKPHVSHNSGNNEWYTPVEYIDAARFVMDGIDLDPASSVKANAVVKAQTYYTVEQNGLVQKWQGRVFMNPPYSAPLISKFCAKLRHHVELGDVSEAIVLVNNATETAWFNDLVSVSRAVCFPTSRVKFWNPDKSKTAPLQGQAIIYIGTHDETFKNVFSHFGWVATLWSNEAK